MNRFMAFIYGAAALFIGVMALSIALGPKGDVSGWVLALAFAAVAAFLARSAWKDWQTPDNQILPPAPKMTRSTAAATPAGPPINAVPLEDQIAALAGAGLTLAPGRTINELLLSWPREDYEEGDPYNLLLFMYGGEVEAEPRGRAFCKRGWEFDMECLEKAGDYARAFERIVRTTGRPDLVTDLSDDFNVDAETAEIRYTVNGRQRVLNADVTDDWADPKAVTAFVKDVEAAVGDHRRFWAADNGQGSILFFITEAEATKINSLRAGILERYA